ncbi:MAG: FHA domain-containing protein [Zoogloeaceae bacterium]|jgi:pSer/pThr/pTyr-binding forkhead associated (FHA) protein|nr:FHA domain-containing protein [Zoogloeaceae bacterium]
MAKLVLSMDGLVLKEIELDKERITIGRRPHNDVQINNLAISGEHAVIVTILNDSFLEDLNSTNGTLVDGKPIKKRVLHHNDVITLGKYTLKFLNDPKAKLADEGRIEMETPLSGGYSRRGTGSNVTPPVGVSSDVGNAGIASSIGTATSFSSADSPVAAATVIFDETERTLPEERAGTTSEDAMAVLRILSGSNKGKELPLSKPCTTLGKPGVQVATIVCQALGYMLQHIEGEQKPLVNGSSIGDEPCLLNDGDVIEIYHVNMRFLLRF